MNYLRSERGAAGAEYALILALFGGAVALSIVGLRNAARGAVENAAVQVATISNGASGGSSSSGGSTNATNSTNSSSGGGSTTDPSCPSGQYNGAGKCKK